MDWRDDGILLSTRPLGEANAIAELLTEQHGRHLGLVRGGRSRRLRPLLQPSNLLHITWRARLPEHLGSVTVELMQAYAAGVLDDPAALLCIESLTSMARMLPERDPHPALYHSARAVLEALGDSKLWPARLVRWELEFLADMGFGIDLSECAATGTTEDLVYVSPKSGRAVSKQAGEPYADKLFRLPAFLLDEEAAAEPGDIVDGFRLSGHFLDRDIYAPHGEALPAARERLMQRLKTSP
ncbi:MAG: DNA repair protein RecO [Methyloligella sp. ZOD6]